MGIVSWNSIGSRDAESALRQCINREGLQNEWSPKQISLFKSWALSYLIIGQKYSWRRFRDLQEAIITTSIATIVHHGCHYGQNPNHNHHHDQHKHPNHFTSWSPVEATSISGDRFHPVLHLLQHLPRESLLEERDGNFRYITATTIIRIWLSGYYLQPPPWSSSFSFTPSCSCRFLIWRKRIYNKKNENSTGSNIFYLQLHRVHSISTSEVFSCF